MKESLPILLAANWEELISVLVGLVFLVIWVINQITGAKKEQARELPPAEPERPIEPDVPGEMQAAPRAGDPLRAQVDEFLRRAAEKRLPEAPAAGPQRPRGGREDIVVLVDDTPDEPARKPQPVRSRSRGDAAAELAARLARQSASKQPRQRPRPPQRAARQRSQSVAEHVAERIGASTKAFQQEVADLGERVKKADEQFDAQVHQKFDHALGKLARREGMDASGAPLPPASSPAAQIAAMLASPDGVRQAMVLNEILRRPEDRW